MTPTFVIKLILDGSNENDPGAIVEGLKEVIKDSQSHGFQLPEQYFRKLVEDTIINGHDLLKCSGIYTLDSAIVESMSVTIGKFLFHRLFKDADKYLKALNEARDENKQLEILLEFTGNKESKKLAKLPWELMYCPRLDNNDEQGNDNYEADDELPDGTYISKEIFISRQIKSDVKITSATEIQWGATVVVIAFLTKDTEGLWEYYNELKQITDNISAQYQQISFKFLNISHDDQKEVSMLTFSQLKEIFAKTINDKNLVLHLICDIADFTGKNDEKDKALYFGKFNQGTDIEKQNFKKIFFELNNQSLLPNPLINLVVLQSWKDPENQNYAGFEQLAFRLLDKNSNSIMDIISMPYVLKNWNLPLRMNPLFFKYLYEGLNTNNTNNGKPGEKPTIKEALLQVRKEIMPNESFGFPIHYSSGRNQVLFGTKMVDFSKPLALKTADSERDQSSDKERMERIKTLLRCMEYSDLLDIEKALEDNKEKAFRVLTTAKEYEIRIKALQELKLSK
jgi:hypothetical protein